MKLALLAIAACATSTQSEYREPDWSDTARTLILIECALGKHDGPLVAEAIMDVEILVRDGYPLAGQYLPPRTIYLNADAKSAMQSALRYELMCRRRSHLVEGSPLKCTPDRWNNVLRPLFHDLIGKCKAQLAWLGEDT